MNNKKGQSLVQVLVSIGLMAIISTLFASLMANQSREIQALTEKQAYLEFTNFAIGALSSGEVCKFETNNPTIQTLDLSIGSIDTAKYTFSELHLKPDPTSFLFAKVGDKPSPLSNSLIVKSIELRDFTGTGPTYLAKWVIQFDETKLIRALHPIEIKTMVNFDNSILTASKVRNCKGIGDTKNVFKIKAAFVEDTPPNFNHQCYGVNSAHPQAVALSSCNPQACPINTTEVSLSVESGGFQTRYNEATGHYNVKTVFNKVRLCETSFFDAIYENRATLHVKYSYGNGSETYVCHGISNPLLPTSCSPLPCQNGDTEIVSQYAEGEGGTLNNSVITSVKVCGK